MAWGERCGAADLRLLNARTPEQLETRDRGCLEREPFRSGWPAKGNVYLAAVAMQSSVFVVVRTERPTSGLEKAIRRAIAAIDPNQPVFLSASMAALIADSFAAGASS